jgi:hypothetical protein
MTINCGSLSDYYFFRQDGAFISVRTGLTMLRMYVSETRFLAVSQTLRKGLVRTVGTFSTYCSISCATSLPPWYVVSFTVM